VPDGGGERHAARNNPTEPGLHSCVQAKCGPVLQNNLASRTEIGRDLREREGLAAGEERDVRDSERDDAVVAQRDAPVSLDLSAIGASPQVVGRARGNGRCRRHQPVRVLSVRKSSLLALLLEMGDGDRRGASHGDESKGRTLSVLPVEDGGRTGGCEVVNPELSQA